MSQILRLISVAAALPFAVGAAVAQEPPPMKFPSFNSVVARPQGVAVQPGAPAVVAPPPPPPAPAQEAAAPPKPKPKPKVVKAKAAPTDTVVSKASETKGLSIAVLVNDEPITGYEIDQRQRLMGLGANIGEKAQANFKRMLQDPSTSERLKGILAEVIKANQGKTKEQVIAIFEERKKQFAMNLQKQAVDSARSSVLPTLRKGALDELIDEKLKLQEAKRLNVVAADTDVARILRSLAEKNKMTETQFSQHMAGMGTDVEVMKSRFRAMLSWNDVVKRRFGHQIAITERDVDRMVSQGPEGEDQVELQLQRLVLAIPEKIDQRQVAARMAEAESLRGKFTGCKTMATLAGAVTNAKFEDLGQRKPSTLTEPTRSLLLAAKDGDVVPPTVGPAGVELYAVCARQVVKASEQKRTAAQEELRQKEFELLAKRHLQNLRQDALIEYR